DSAINYRFQRAERSIGRAIARSIERDGVARDELFLSTKNGYLAPDGESPIPLEDYVQLELIRKGRLRPSDIVDGSHAMSVPFLTDQFGRSRANLGVEAIDLLYLHNAADAQIPVVGRVEFLERLFRAFELFEGFRAAGQLGAYGLATWDSLRSSRSAPSYLSIEEVLDVARRAGGSGHGFRFLQFPFNLARPEAAVLRNQPIEGTRTTLFEAAQRSSLGCFTSIPLLQGRLAEDGPAVPGLTRAQSALQFARSAPGTIAPLIGQKTPEHLSENLTVAERAPWGEAEFRSLL
ncbi:MAG TPA: aldo/keto reductase, partial [Thermoplasmata archaeon]|nr:aldo/keto reductase [Thermoplasmata archaeon]